MRALTKKFLAAMLSLAVGTVFPNQGLAASPAAVRAENGMVVTAHHLA